MILTLVRRTPVRGGVPRPSGSPPRPKTARSAGNAGAPAPASPSADDELEVLCRSLRIISARDMDGTVTVVFRSILIAGRDRAVGSSELAAAARLNRVTVIHHLQRLERLGLVEHSQHKYRLRASGLSEMVERMRAEMMESFEQATSMAETLERQFLLIRSREDDPSFDEDALPHTPLLQKANGGKKTAGRKKISR